MMTLSFFAIAFYAGFVTFIGTRWFAYFERHGLFNIAYWGMIVWILATCVLPFTLAYDLGYVK